MTIAMEAPRALETTWVGPHAARFRAVLSTFSQLSIGVVALSRSGEVLLINDEAERIIGVVPGIDLEPGRLNLHGRFGEELHEALEAVHRSPIGDDRRGGAAIRLPACDDHGAIVAEVSPGGSGIGSGKDQDMAILTLMDVSRRVAAAAARFAERYRLSTAERDITALLLEGRDVEKIAEVRGRSTTTVRNQVRSLLSKAGIRRQVDLFRLAAFDMSA